MCGFMMDGNFQAEHMKMRNPENDIPLSEGAGFMVSQKPYELHLQSAFEGQQVISIISGISAGRSWFSEKKSTCHDHHTVNNVNKHGGHLKSTGIGATACIHGAFVPNSIVDFQKGEVWVPISQSIRRIHFLKVVPLKPEEYGLFNIQGSKL